MLMPFASAHSVTVELRLVGDLAFRIGELAEEQKAGLVLSACFAERMIG